LDIHLGQTARDFRVSLGLTQRAAADALGVSYVHLCNVEKNRTAPSQALVDRYRELWGVDLHVLAWCSRGNVNMLPKDLRRAASELDKAWRDYVDSLVESNELKASG
jgi:transcriptional regulator with XRE-family HTH domain